MVPPLALRATISGVVVLVMDTTVAYPATVCNLGSQPRWPKLSTVTLTLPPPATVGRKYGYDPATLRPMLPDWSQHWMVPVRYKSARGGRGSAKSHTVAQIAILRMANLLPAYRDTFEPVRIASARAFQVHISGSVKQVVADYIHAYGLSDDFKIFDQRIVHRNGSEMTFPGIERGVEAFLSKEGLDVFWVEQAEFLTDEHMDFLLPTIRKATAERWFVWNPMNRTGWCWQRFVANPRPEDLSLKVNWENNPWWALTGLQEELDDDLEFRPHIVPWKWGGEPNDLSGDAVLPYALLTGCRKAYARGLCPDVSGMPVYAGLDLAWGGEDLCALVIRQGPLVLECHVWPGVAGDLSEAAAKARDFCKPYNLARIYYDASAQARTDLLRAGFRGVHPENFGGGVKGPDRLYERDRPNSAVFAARNMQMADALRLRATRTAKLLKGGEVDPASCLFIKPDMPRVEQFLSECSQPVRRFNIVRGLWEVDKTGDTKGVAARSPDRFDGLSLSFARDSERGLVAR